jgi:hypothetical protein
MDFTLVIAELRSVVENELDHQRWSIPFAAVNIDSLKTDIGAVAPEQRALDR